MNQREQKNSKTTVQWPAVFWQFSPEMRLNWHLYHSFLLLIWQILNLTPSHRQSHVLGGPSRE